MAIITANNEYKYDKIIFKYSIDDWVQKLHQHNCLNNNLLKLFFGNI